MIKKEPKEAGIRLEHWRLWFDHCLFGVCNFSSGREGMPVAKGVP